MTYHLIPLPEPLWAVDIEPFDSGLPLGGWTARELSAWRADHLEITQPTFNVLRAVCWRVDHFESGSVARIVVEHAGLLSETAVVESTAVEALRAAEAAWWLWAYLNAHPDLRR